MGKQIFHNIFMCCEISAPILLPSIPSQNKEHVWQKSYVDGVNNGTLSFLFSRIKGIEP